MAEVRFINPETLAKPPSYTHVVEVVGACRTVHISGQLGIDLEGQVVGDFGAQAVQVFENLKAALASVGATFADVVKLNSYLADIADLPVLREVRVRHLYAKALPASTTIAVSGFARPGALLEIEAVAVLPLEASPAKSSRPKPSRAKKAAVAKRAKATRRKPR